MTCTCGEPATQPLYLCYRRPRPAFEPMAVDPHYVQGCNPTRTCGAAGCEAEAYAALMAEHPDAEVWIDASPGASFRVIGDDPA